MLFQVAANQFLVVKKTWPNMFILSCGSVLNVLLNLVLIPRIGIEGAAIATLAGYFISDLVCVIVLCKMKLMVVSVRFVLAVLLTSGFMCLWRMLFSEKIVISFGIALLACVVFVMLYLKDISNLLNQKR